MQRFSSAGKPVECGETVSGGEMTAEASLVCRRYQRPFTPTLDGRSTLRNPTPGGAKSFVLESLNALRVVPHSASAFVSPNGLRSLQQT
jgi:hypothetical protein